jgi:hypothetical protein
MITENPKGRTLKILQQSTGASAATDIEFALKNRLWRVGDLLRKVLDGTLDNPQLLPALLARPDVSDYHKDMIRLRQGALIPALEFQRVRVQAVNGLLNIATREFDIREVGRRAGPEGGRYVLVRLQGGDEGEVEFELSLQQVVKLNHGSRTRTGIPVDSDGETQPRQFYVESVRGE